MDLDSSTRAWVEEPETHLMEVLARELQEMGEPRFRLRYESGPDDHARHPHIRVARGMIAELDRTAGIRRHRNNRAIALGAALIAAVALLVAVGII